MLNLQLAEKRVPRSDGSLEIVDCFNTIQGEGPFAGYPATFLRLAGCNLTCSACDTDYTSVRILQSPDELCERVRNMGKALTEKYKYPFARDPVLVITGGEPFRQGCGLFIYKALDIWDGPIQFETNGTLFDESMAPEGHCPQCRGVGRLVKLDAPPNSEGVLCPRCDGEPDHPQNLYDCEDVWIVCSPKTGTLNKRLMPYISALKYIVEAGKVDPTDGLPTDSLLSGVVPAKPWQDFEGEIYVQPLDEGDPEKNKRHAEAAVESCLKFGYILCLQMHKIVNLP